MQAETRPIMDALIDTMPQCVKTTHLKKLNLILLDKLLHTTTFPSTTEFVSYIMKGIPQWGTIPAFGVFGNETRPSKNEQRKQGSYENQLPTPDIEFA